MVQVDLITGFLGAGKTTFLRRYAAYLTAQGHHVCILENDFGAVNVDAMLVQDLLGERCEIETISGGGDCDTHQRRMRTKLIAMAMRGFDRVVVEPSGIFDVDEFFDILRDGLDVLDTILIFIQRIIYIQCCAAGIPENRIHAVFQQNLQNQLGTCFFHTWSLLI